MPTTIDLNADLGEGTGQDAGLMPLVTSANICCAAHAGTPDETLAALTLARAHGVTAGAHPGYPDRAGFGRLPMAMTASDLEHTITRQIALACSLADRAGARIAYVKPHGALYSQAATNPAIAATLTRAIRAVDPGLALLILSGTRIDGLRTFAEVFADRTYQPDGTLTPRGQPGAVLHDPDQILTRTLAMLATGCVPTDRGPLPMRMDSLCLHGDTPGAVALARRLREGLVTAGHRLAAFLPA